MKTVEQNLSGPFDAVGRQSCELDGHLIDKIANYYAHQQSESKQVVRVATQYAPDPFQPPSRAPEQTQRSSTFPRRIRSHADRCSCLTR